MPVVENRARILAISLVVALSISCSRDPEIAKREYLASGDKFLSQQKVREAIVQYRNALAQDPRFGEARYKLAEAYAQHGDAWRGGARVRESGGSPAKGPSGPTEGRTVSAVLSAVRRRQELVRITRSRSTARMSMRKSCSPIRSRPERSGRSDRGNRGSDQAGSQNTLGYAGLGAMKQAVNRQDEAEAAFKKAVEIDPESVPAHLGLANFYWAARRKAETGRRAHDGPQPRSRSIL